MKALFLILSKPKYLAPSLVFASLNFVFGTWAIYIPTVQQHLGIDKAALGIAIFYLALGTFFALPFASWIIRFFGVGKSTGIGVLLIAITALFPLLANEYYLLLLGLFLLGAAQGFTDIAMNGLVSHIEKQDSKNLMTATHGFFSLGGVLAGLGSFLIPFFKHPAMHMAVVVFIVGVVNLIYFKHYKHIKTAATKRSPVSFSDLKPLLLLGGISFVVMGSEGAIVDWSGLYLKEIASAPVYFIGGGFLLFSACMTFARFFGDGLSTRIGSLKIIKLGALVALVGYLLVLSASLYLVLLGFALTGLGFSVIVPEVFRLGGQSRTITPEKAITIVAGFGYSGFLLTPVLLGFFAKHYGLKISFFGLAVAISLVLLFSFYLVAKKDKAP